MSTPARKVLVLGRDERAFLAVIRSLGRQGIEVHGAWCPPDALARRSTYLTRVHELPPYRPADDAWKHALVALLRQERYDLVIPTNDPSIIPLQRHRDDLEPHARIYLLDDAVFAVAFDKQKTHEQAAALGIRVPRQVRLAVPFDPAVVLGAFPLPVVLKPRASFRADDVGRKSVVRTAFSPAELEAHLRAFATEGEVLAQEYVEGTGVGVEGIAERGTVLLAFQHERVHEHPRTGLDSYRKAVPLTPALREAFDRMMGALRYTGVAMLEFRVNHATGDWALLDLNARFWGSLPLAVAAGADFPYHAVQLLVEGRRDFPQGYRTGIYCRNWGRDVAWLRENFRAPRAARVPLARLIREIGPALVGREYSDTLVLDDPRPGLEEVRRLAGRAAARLGRTVRALVAAAPPVRRVNGARARRALREADHVLFVCRGNICRSPFAAHYARTALAGATVTSAGYHPQEGRRCPEEALAAAREAGIDLAAHRSSVLATEQVRSATAIFVFDRQNYNEVVSRFPAARRKLHLLGDLAANGTREIRDPYGRSLDTFRATYRTIRHALDAGLGGAAP